jgi:hypothetical protein
MNKETLIKHLGTKPDADMLINEVVQDNTVLTSLFEIALTEMSSVKYVSTKIIRKISEQEPKLVYPYFDDIVKWLYHENNFIKWDGIAILSNLVAVDNEGRFEAIYQDYFALLKNPQMITAANVVGNAWKIVLAKPEWEDDITKRLLKVKNIVYLNKGKPSPECSNIICGKVLECFEHYFKLSDNKE